MKMFQLMVVLILIWATGASCLAFEFVTPSKSKRRAMQRGQLLASVSVTPDEFQWKGHKYRIHEAWLEKPKEPKKRDPKYKDYVAFCFTFEVNGKYPSDFDRLVEFREAPGIYSFGWGKYHVNALNTEPNATEVKLHIVDRLSKDFRAKDPPKPEDPELVFRVDSDTAK